MNALCGGGGAQVVLSLRFAVAIGVLQSKARAIPRLSLVLISLKEVERDRGWGG
jgi:hypothetical protein